MAWRWSRDKPLSEPTRDSYLYNFTNSDPLYIWCPRVDDISWSDLNNKNFDHSEPPTQQRQ